MPAEIYFEDINVGDEIPQLKKQPVTEVQLVKYAGASGDFNQIHTVQRIGELAGLNGVIAHGMLIMGFVAQAITAWLPKRNLRKFKVRFGSITRPGDVITVAGRVTDKRTENDQHFITCEVTAKDEKGDTKIVGEFEAALPSKN